MTQGDWQNGGAHVVGMLIYGEATDESDERGRPGQGDTVLLILNGGDEDVRFTVPAVASPGQWSEVLDSAGPETPLVDGTVPLRPHSLVLLRYGTERRLAATAHPEAVNTLAVASAGAGEAAPLPDVTAGVTARVNEAEEVVENR
jgi:hypothetical protein